MDGTLDTCVEVLVPCGNALGDEPEPPSARMPPASSVGTLGELLAVIASHYFPRPGLRIQSQYAYSSVSQAQRIISFARHPRIVTMAAS